MSKLKILLPLVLVLFNSTFHVKAEGSNTERGIEGEAIVVKCYVELMGGERTIHTFISSSKDKTPSNLKHSMIGHRIYNGPSNEKVAIYKIDECVYKSEKFKSAQANTLDAGLD